MKYAAAGMASEIGAGDRSPSLSASQHSRAPRTPGEVPLSEESMERERVAKWLRLLIAFVCLLLLSPAKQFLGPVAADLPEEPAPFDDGQSTPPGQRRQPNVPVTDLELTLSLEPYAPFTTVSHVAPEALRLPKHTKATFSVRSNYPVADFVWTGASEVSRRATSSSAEITFKKKGAYTVSVTPMIRLPDGSLERRAGRSKSIAITATDIQPRKIAIRITDPTSAPMVGYKNQIHNCKAETSPPGYENLIEWTGGGSPWSGLGPRFSTSYSRKGRFNLRAGPSSTLDFDIYEVASIRWESPHGQMIWYGFPITFAALTDPPGFGDHVPWRVESMHDMVARAEPSVGKGATFKTAFHPTKDGRSLWAQVFAADVAAFANPDQPPPPCTSAIDGTPCSDNDVCTAPDTCAGGICVGGPPYPGFGCPPAPATDYEDQNPPTADICCGCGFLGTLEGNLPLTPEACAPPGYACSIPVGLSNGEVKLRVVDLSVPSRGFPFEWSRSYSSRQNFSGPLGFNWEISYQRRVFPVDATTVSVVNGGGREDVYKGSGGSQFTSPAGVFDDLIRNGDNTYTQTDPAGMRFDYDVDGYLTAMTDRNGNTLSMQRNSHHNITQITDTQGRPYAVAYTDVSASQKVASITDFAGRQVVYSYDGNGDLIRLRGPVVTGTPNGNDFPGGKTTLYTYTSGSPNMLLNHNLLAIVDPAHNVSDDPALSRAKVMFTYATTTDPDMPEFDHVVAERWGHDQGGPPSNPGVVVGGTQSFAYAMNLTGDSDAPAGAVLRTTVTDANGNVQVHYFNSSRLETKTIVRTNRNVRPGEADYATTYAYTPAGLLASRTDPRGNGVAHLYDVANPRPVLRQNLLEERRRTNGIAGGGVDLVTRYTYEPVFNQRRTTTDPRAFPAGSVPLDAFGHLNLGNSLVARYTTTLFFDYQEGTGFQSARGVPLTERIPEGLGNLNGAVDFNEGNVVKVGYPTIQTPGPNTGQVIAELMTYNDLGQMLTKTDPEGHVTRLVYFPSNGTPNDPSDREGYLQSTTRDFGGFNLLTQYEYDSVGNVTRVVDPKGQDMLTTVNALNQVVRMQSRLVFGTTRYQVDTFYDANDNVERVEAQNFKDDGALYAHNPLVSTFEFDILRNPVAQVLDRSLNDNSQTGTVRTEHFYDANLNRTAVKLPLAVGGSVPSNIVTTLYDERDLPYKAITGDNDTNPANAPPSNAVVVTTNYDPNRSVLETIDSIRNAQHSFAPTTSFPGTAPGDVTKRTYDGFDRQVKSIDGEGNERAVIYDFVSNPIQTTLRGPVDHLVNTLSLLSQIDTTFDELNRVVQADTRHLDTKTGVNVGDGHSISQTKYDRDSKVLEVTDDRGLKTTIQWDSADRRFKILDQLNNEVEYGYDANSNVTMMTRRDVSTDLATAAETFVTTNTYDGVDRVTKTVDPAGDVSEVFYDSRSNPVKTSDGLRGTAHPSGPGNVVRKDFDGLNRLVKTEYVLTSNGRGDSAQTGIITTRQAWDDDSRLISQTDDNNHATGYTYDALNRLTAITYADTTTRTTQFDTDNHVTQWTDQNGSIVVMNYDGLDRLLGRTVTRGTGVVGSTLENFGYDGAGRTTLAQNDDGINPGTMDRLFEYDSLSNRTKDQQGILSVDSVFDGVANRTQITYPGQFGDGRRVVTLAYDSLNRLQAASDSGGPISTMHYKGPARLERRTYGVDATPFSRLDVTYDTLPRTIDMNHTTGAAATIARFQYGYDRRHNRLFEKRVHDGNVGDVYRYDSIYRVIRNPKDIDLSAIPPGTEIDPDAYSGAPNWLEYAFDGVGNRTSTTQVLASTPTVTTYTQTPGGTLKDAEVNQYSSTQEASLPVKTYAYDQNGNLTSDGSNTYAYDFKNRLAEVRDQATRNLIAQYSYDAANRRGMKTLLAGTTHYLFDGIQVVEERDGSNAITRQFVWGNGIDQLLQENTASATHYAHENAIGSIAALTNTSGTAVERYQYDPFGNTTLTLDGTTGNRHRFQGAYFDDETSLYYMRARTYSPALGRFLQPDPIGVWTDEASLGNAYTFAGNNPVTGTDPMGQKKVTITMEMDPGLGESLLLKGEFYTVKNMVQLHKEITARFKNSGFDKKGENGDCIEKLTIAGHGEEGRIQLPVATGEVSSTEHPYYGGGELGQLMRNPRAGRPDVPEEIKKKVEQIDKERRDMFKRAMTISRTHSFEFLVNTDEFRGDQGKKYLPILFLGWIKDLLCEESSTVEFGMCKSGAGESGQALKKVLEEIFGENVTVKLFEKNCKPGYGGFCETKDKSK